MTMPPKISDKTRETILNSAWDLMAEQRRLDAGMAEIAAAAGVTRQSVFYAFGNRAGLLVAMARHRDTRSDHVQRMGALAAGAGADLATLQAYVDVWLDYLPIIYPVAIQLEAASLTDTDADAAWRDRMFDQGLRLGLDLIIRRMATAGALAEGQDADHAADLCQTWLLPSAWRYLVVERGWTPAAFAASRHDLLKSLFKTRRVRASGRSSA
ncbi:MAG: TetR/AcrR family transcriptional regulator [Burkholderiaceae bacterium]